MSEEDKLIKAISRLERSVRRSSSLGWTILRGLVYSLGWVIGLATLAVIAYYLLPRISDDNAIGRFVHAVIRIIQRNEY